MTTFETAIGMLRRRRCSPELIAAYLTCAVTRTQTKGAAR